MSQADLTPVNEMLKDFQELLETHIAVSNKEIDDKALSRFLLFIGNTYPSASLITTQMVANIWEYLQNSSTIRSFVFNLSFSFFMKYSDEEKSQLVERIVENQAYLFEDTLDQKLRTMYTPIGEEQDRTTGFLLLNTWLITCVLLSVSLPYNQTYKDLLHSLRN